MIPPKPGHAEHKTQAGPAQPGGHCPSRAPQPRQISVPVTRPLSESDRGQRRGVGRDPSRPAVTMTVTRPRAAGRRAAAGAGAVLLFSVFKLCFRAVTPT